MLNNNFLDNIESNPKKLFIIDGFGAILSAFMLGIVLVKLEFIFGIPPSALYFLAALPVLFSAYDLYCYQKPNNQLAPFLRGIAGLNLSYCCLSIGLAIFHSNSIKGLGWAYLTIEVLILIVLIIIEFRAAKKVTEENLLN